ncbi:MAG: hypothetical protein ACLSAH_22040 [Bilophila wadsworthia]
MKVRYSYVDWVVPQTDVKVRMGLQKYTLPNFTGIGSRSSTLTARVSPSATSSLKMWVRTCSAARRERQ